MAARCTFIKKIMFFIDNQETGVIVGVSIAGTTIIGIVVAAAIVGCVRYISMKLKGAEVSKKNEPQIPRYMKAGFYNATPESGDEGMFVVPTMYSCSSFLVLPAPIYYIPWPYS